VRLQELTAAQEVGSPAAVQAPSPNEPQRHRSPTPPPRGRALVPGAERRIALTQNQLKLSARLEVAERRVRGAGRGCNEAALGQLRAATASLQRATQAAQGAKKALDAAFDDLRGLLEVSSPSAAAAEAQMRES